LNVGEVTLSKLKRKEPQDLEASGYSKRGLASPSTAHLKVVRILRDKAATRKDEPLQIYDLLIENKSAQPATLLGFHARWKYERGLLAAIEGVIPLKVNTEDLIEFPIDVESMAVQDKRYDAHVPIRLEPRSQAVIRLTLHYYFVGELNYHPNPDWDLIFSVDLVDDYDSESPIWREQSWKGADRF